MLPLPTGDTVLNLIIQFSNSSSHLDGGEWLVDGVRKEGRGTKLLAILHGF